MRLLLDLCISPRVGEALRGAGHDAVRVRPSPEEREDEAVLSRALREGRVLVTGDKDFGEVLSLGSGPRVGVLRLLEMSPSRQAEFALAALARYGAELERGALVVASPGRTRVRPRDDAGG
jgi:predicted nuclease of predicted toxin-antitoxin system